MSLSEKLIVVAGGTGNVGEGVVRAFLREGARVVVPSRSDERIALLRRQLGDEGERVIGMVGDTSTFDGMQHVADRIANENGPIHHVVVGLGEWWQGKPVWDVSEDEFQRYVVQPGALHLGAVRAFVPRLADGGSYSFVAGLTAVMPLQGMSLVGIHGGAQLMLSQELQADVGERVRVNTLILGFIVSRSRPTGQPEWLTADEVGIFATRVAQSDLRGQLIRLDDKAALERRVTELKL